MGRTYLGNSYKIKMYLGNIPIHRMYLGNERIYPNAGMVTYHVDTNVTYTEEVDIDESILNPSTFTPSKSGWTFVGWRKDTAANGSVLSNEVMTGDDVTLYAVFRQTITLSYNGNGSTGGSTASQSGYRYYNNGNASNPSFILRENGFSRSGYVWTRWAQGSTSGAQYSAGSSVTLSTSTTFYSVWVQQAYNYSYTGGMQSFDVPCDGIYKLQVYGAQGGATYGGAGGYSIGYRQLSKGTVLYICVGGAGGTSQYGDVDGGYNGGGLAKTISGPTGSGGGCTHIATRSGTLQALGNTSGLLIVAGGGGGGHQSSRGGTGGGTNGGDAPADGQGIRYGGTQTQGGLGAGNKRGSFGKGSDGTYGGANNNFDSGGGAGLYGGGNGYGNGAGGGSGYIGGVPSFSYDGTTYSPSTSNGQRSGNGYATITLMVAI